jgi:hypothetical protein
MNVRKLIVRVVEMDDRLGKSKLWRKNHAPSHTPLWPKAMATQIAIAILPSAFKFPPPSHSVVLREFCHGLQHLAVTAQGVL